MPDQTTDLTVRRRATSPSDGTWGTARMDDALRRAATDATENRAGLRAQLLAYAIVSVVVASWVAGGGDVVWPLLPMAAWGIGLTFHALRVWSAAPTDAELRSELLLMTR